MTKTIELLVNKWWNAIIAGRRFDKSEKDNNLEQILFETRPAFEIELTKTIPEYSFTYVPTQNTPYGEWILINFIV